MEYNGKYMMENNFQYTKTLMHFAMDRKIPFLYASSASTYGSGQKGFREEPACEEALNVYAFSKLFFDNYARRYFDKAESQIAGFRYFNVYGPQENHKGKMASMVRQMFLQWQQDHEVKLFGEYDAMARVNRRGTLSTFKDVVKVLFLFLAASGTKGCLQLGNRQSSHF